METTTMSMNKIVNGASTLLLALAVGGCSGNNPATPPDLAPLPDLAMPKPEYAAVVRGTLASMDLAMDEATHDAIAKAGEASSKAAGDFAHDVLLGTTLLDSTKNELLAIDRWSDAQ